MHINVEDSKFSFFDLPMKIAAIIALIVLFTGTACMAFRQGQLRGVAEEQARFQDAAKRRGYAWHDRQTGEWTWKTLEEVQDLTYTPPINTTDKTVGGR